MHRLMVGACAGALLTLPAPSRAALDARALPMQFELRLEGPVETCAAKCRTFIAATGAIAANTARDFEAFAKERDIRGATLVLDSDGGSVLGALALGRAVRKLEMVTTVGRLADLDGGNKGAKRARLMPRAYCESMCAFVLLAGVERTVPAEAKVLVHQIWLGDRRDDPTAANYSAEDLVLVQRDIGRIAQYTVEMGGGIDLLETALRIPPWEPMRELTRDELRGMKIVTADHVATTAAAASTASPTPILASGSRIAAGERSWQIADNSGALQLTRRHPLTVEGEDIGSFELSFSCGDTAKDYNVSYVERRRGGDRTVTPGPLTGVGLSLAGEAVTLKVVSSRPGGQSVELQTIARGAVPADVVKAFAELRAHSITVETVSAKTATNIRVGNVGVASNFQKLADFCVARAPVRNTALRSDQLAADQPR